MKLLNKVLIFIVLSNFLFISAQNNSSEINAECKANITVKTNINNSLIFLDNKIIGKGNARINLAKGEYILKATKETWGAKSFEDTIIVKDCSNKNINYVFDSEVYLKTAPQDAYVFNNDSLIGHTPLFIPLDISEIELRKDGYENKILELNNISSNELVELEFIGSENGESFFKRDIFKILLGSLVILGGTTAYYKLKADERFEEYQFTGNKDVLEQTRKYDLISGITFTALQINFGFLIYYFLIE